MSKVPDLSHERIVTALSKAGFVVVREGKHTSMYNQSRRVMAPAAESLIPSPAPMASSYATAASTMSISC